MKRTLLVTSVVAALLGACKKSERKTAPKGVREVAAKAPRPAAKPETTAGGVSFLADFRRDLDYVEKKLLRLARAIPQEKLTWRAHPKTKSLAELLLHIAEAHFHMPAWIGIPKPADLAGRDIEKDTTDKTKIIAMVKRSFAHARLASRKVSAADLAQTFARKGRTRSKRMVFLIMIAHQHEHLGQLTAWTRSAGVAKPWLAERDRRHKKRRH